MMYAAIPTEPGPGPAGHRQRLRERFLAGDVSAHTDAALLELLLTYTLPRRDVADLAGGLLAEFGDLAGVLAADPERLLAMKGVKERSATLLKLVDAIRHTLAANATAAPEEPHERDVADRQMSLFDALEAMESPAAPDAPAVSTPAEPMPSARATGVTHAGPSPRRRAPKAKAASSHPRGRTDLFTTAFLRDAIEVLPRLPDTDSAEEIRAYLRGVLHYSSAQSRERVAAYIMRRLFPAGAPDRALRLFARHYDGRQELRDAAFYRFCVAEPLAFALMEDLVLPAVATGQLDRERVRAYLAARFPSSKSLLKCVQAFADALGPARIARVERTTIAVAYRDIALPSFAFVLHSEFPAPGMYAITKLEGNRAIRALLWNPDQVLSALYELRNRGILSKVSEIDSVRQFTTRMPLERAVEAMATMPAEGMRA